MSVLFPGPITRPLHCLQKLGAILGLVSISKGAGGIGFSEGFPWFQNGFLGYSHSTKTQSGLVEFAFKINKTWAKSPAQVAPRMPGSLLQIVESTTLNAETISARTAQIHATVLSKSKYIDGPNFTRIHSADLELLFTEYDSNFFSGQIKDTLGTIPLYFRPSRRMTSSGGKTASYADRSGRRWYEIGVSTAVLFECFRGEDHRPISASGIICRDRLDALQRVMEHELVHLIEMLLWGKSSCLQPRFHSITLRFFGHTTNKHLLITPRETALVKFGIKPGMAVRFRFEGAQRTGIVNRVSKRATVLVEDPAGQRYSNGKHYAKFYVPVQFLEAVE